MLVSRVTAMTFGLSRPSRIAVSDNASAVRFIISTPPLACTLKIETPSRVASTPAAATVFGMSWNFRSRKIRPPFGNYVANDLRSRGGEKLRTDLEHARRHRAIRRTTPARGRQCSTSRATISLFFPVSVILTCAIRYDFSLAQAFTPGNTEGTRCKSLLQEAFAAIRF